MMEIEHGASVHQASRLDIPAFLYARALYNHPKNSTTLAGRATITCAPVVALALAFTLIACDSHTLRAQGVQSFGTPAGSLPIRGFGDPTSEEALRLRFPHLVVNVAGYDRLVATSQMRKHDTNKDGIATKEEWLGSDGKESRFTESDFDGDGKVTEFEHTLWWVQYRVGRSKAKLDVKRKSLAREKALQKPDSAEQRADSVAPEMRKQAESLAEHILDRYDQDNSRAVERSEFKNQRSPYGNLSAADANRDGRVVKTELANWLLDRVPQDGADRLEPELKIRDINKDGQISLHEFAPEPTEQLLAQFTSIDHNGDGLITPKESTRRSIKEVSATEFASNKMSVFVGYGVAISEIDVVEDLVIDDIDIRVQLSKDDDNFLQLVLIPPDNRTIVLFRGGWYPWRPPIFDDTLIDDDAQEITRMLRAAPNPRSLQPPGARDEEQRSLNDLKGLNIRGRWRLVVRNQNDDEGLLRRWSLVVRGMPGNSVTIHGGDIDDEG